MTTGVIPVNVRGKDVTFIIMKCPQCYGVFAVLEEPSYCPYCACNPKELRELFEKAKYARRSALGINPPGIL